MDTSFKKLDKEWNEVIHDIFKKTFVKTEEPIPNDFSYALEYVTLKKLISKEIKPKLVVINGPAGAGKSTIGKFLEDLGLERIPRITDRPKRTGEIDGKDYHFVANDVFEKLNNEGKILGAKNTYGFKRGFLKETFAMLDDSKNSKTQFYTEGDSSLKAFQEAQNLFGFSSDIVLNIFILPPSFEELYRRVSVQHQEGSFTNEEFKTRMSEGIHYLSKSVTHLVHFPNSLFLVNDNIDRLNPIFSFFCLNKTIDKDAFIPYLSDEGTIQGITTRDFAHTLGILHPIAVVYIFNSRGELLIQKRFDNGLWDHSAAGHVSVGETYEDTAHRELNEELGVLNVKLSLVGKETIIHKLTPIKTRHYFYLYTCTYEGRFTIQPEEVLEVKHISLVELEQLLSKEPEKFSGGLHATYAFYKACMKNIH